MLSRCRAMPAARGLAVNGPPSGVKRAAPSDKEAVVKAALGMENDHHG